MGGLFVKYFRMISARTVAGSISRPRRLYRANTQTLSQVLCAQQPGPETCPFPRSRTSRPITAREFTLPTTSIAPPIFGSAAPGYSSQHATAALEDVFHQTMPPKWASTTMGMSYQEQNARAGVCQPGAIFATFTSLRFSDSCGTL